MRSPSAVALLLAALCLGPPLAGAIPFFVAGHTVEVGWREDSGPLAECVRFDGDSESEPCEARAWAEYRNRWTDWKPARVGAYAYVNATYCLRASCAAPASVGAVAFEPTLVVDPGVGGPRTLP